MGMLEGEVDNVVIAAAAALDDDEAPPGVAADVAAVTGVEWVSYIAPG
jgi:hypothetical protein